MASVYTKLQSFTIRTNPTKSISPSEGEPNYKIPHDKI